MQFYERRDFYEVNGRVIKFVIFPVERFWDSQLKDTYLLKEFKIVVAKGVRTDDAPDRKKKLSLMDIKGFSNVLLTFQRLLNSQSSHLF